MGNKYEYCYNCEHFAFGDFNGNCCYIGYNPKECPIARRNKQIAEYEKAKEELKKEIEKPFIKFLERFKKKKGRRGE